MDRVSGKARGVFRWRGGGGVGTIKFGDRLLVINKDDFTEHLRVEDDN